MTTLSFNNLTITLTSLLTSQTGPSTNFATNLFVTILTTLISIGLIYLLYRGIRKENIKFLALNESSITLEPVEFKQIISRVMARDKCEYVLLEISLHDVESIEKVCGEDQYALAVSDLLHRIKLNLPNGIKISIPDKERIWVFLKGRLKKDGLEILVRNLIKDINKPIVLIGSLEVIFEVNIAGLIYEKSLKDVESVFSNLALTTIVAKKNGQNNSVIFDRSISNISTEEYTLFQEIKEAIKNNDFRVFYQPIVSTDTMECYAVEAYLRWQHAEKGIISPDVFMASLEHSGDINWVGLWALESITKQLEYWRINNADVRIKVNINWSLTQLSNTQLGEKVKSIVKKYKVNTSDFCFEIPNYKQAMSIEVASRNINFFRQLGIGIAIDNFNLEVNTIAELDGNEVHMLKLNRNFVSKLTDENSAVLDVATMIAKSSASKHIKVVGEGIEDANVLEKLKEIGIPLAQGYFISRPKAPTEAMADIVLTPWKE